MSDDQLRAAINKIVRGGDLNELSAKVVRQSLESQFNIDLSARKDFVKSEIEKVMASLQSQEEEEDEEEEEEEPSGKSKTAKRKKPAKSKDDQPKRAAPSGFTAPLLLSAELAAFTGVTAMPRASVTKFIANYVKEHNLKDESDGRNFKCDEALQKLLGVELTNYMGLAKLLKPHFLGKDPNAPQSETVVKKAKKEKLPPGAPLPRTAFNRPMKLSAALADVIQMEHLSRPQVTKCIWIYIRANNLQDPANKREINCDSKLEALFGQTRVNMMQMAGLLSKHFSPIEDAAVLESAWKVQDELVAANASKGTDEAPAEDQTDAAEQE